MHWDWMQCNPGSLVKCIPIECIGFHAAWLNSVYSRQHEIMEAYWMKCILCSMIECTGFLQHEWMQWIFCSVAQSIPIECSGFHAASLNADDSMHCGTMDPDCIQCGWRSEAQCIPIECSGLHAAWPKASRLKAVDSMQHDWIHWIICSMAQSILIERSGFHAASLNAEHSIHCGAMDLGCM